MSMGPEVGPEAEVLEAHDLHEQSGGRLKVMVVTPTAMVVEQTLDEIVAPGVEGEFGVLPGHVPFVSALKAGVLAVRDGATRELYAVGPGFLEVSAGGRTRVLVQRALAASAVDVEDARAQKAAAEEQLRQAAAGVEGAPGAVGQAQASLEWAQAQLDASAAAAHAGR